MRAEVSLVEPLLQLSQSKMHLLSHFASTTTKDSRDILRRGILLQRTLDRVTIAKELQDRRRIEESIFERPQLSKARSWRAHDYSQAMQSLSEEDEEEAVVDPSAYVDVASLGVEEVEGQEAWFEQTWRDLQSSDSYPTASYASVSISPVEDDDLSISSGSSRSTTPSPTPQEFQYTLPPSPSLRPTIIDDRLNGPVEPGTMPAKLEHAMPIEDIMDLYEILDDEEELDLAPPTFEQQSDSHLYYDSASDSDEDDDDQLLVTPNADLLDDFSPSTSFEDSYAMDGYMQHLQTKSEHPIGGDARIASVN